MTTAARKGTRHRERPGARRTLCAQTEGREEFVVRAVRWMVPRQ